MIIHEYYSAIALDLADKKRKSMNVNFAPDALNAYKKTINKMAKSSSYNERDEIKEKDLETIIEGMRNVFDTAVDDFAKQDDEVKNETDIHKFVMVAHDYLFAFTSKQLKCPDIPKEPLENLLGDFSKKMIEKLPIKIDSAKNFFDQQRGKDARELELGSVGRLFNQIESKQFTPRHMAELLGEYKALKKRQEKHGAIWRLFHGKQNEARNEMLKRMEEDLKQNIPEEDLNKMEEPIDVIRYYKHEDAKKMINFSVIRRDANPSLDFEYARYDLNPDLYDEYMKELENRKDDELDLSNQLEIDTTTEKSNSKTEQIAEPNVKSSPEVKQEF